MRVELLYFDGCPSGRVAADNLSEALRRSGNRDEIHHRLVETLEAAEAIGFPGSPTILIDGRDPFAASGAGSPAPAALACRLYRTPEGAAGAPTVDQILATLS